jgi:hypothetical protein
MLFTKTLHLTVEEHQRSEVYYANIKIKDKLPVCIANLVMDKKHFILILKRFLIIQSFYSVNEVLDYEY